MLRHIKQVMAEALPRKRGFTLVEVMFAMVIVAIVTLGVYQLTLGSARALFNTRANSRKELNQRKAGNTTISAAIISGVVCGDDSVYSGGVDDFPRFLENGTGRTATMRGAFISLFDSEVNTGNWRGGRVYQAPHRNWGLQHGFPHGDAPADISLTARLSPRLF